MVLVSKSAKDYDRKDKRADILSRMDEGEERSIIQQACIQKLIDNFSGRESNYENKEELEYAIFQQLEQLDVADCVDPRNGSRWTTQLVTLLVARF